jgi:hypothetical protein
MVSDARRAEVRSATNALLKLATQCLLLHQPVGVIGPTGRLLANPTARTASPYRQSAGGSMGVAIIATAPHSG